LAKGVSMSAEQQQPKYKLSITGPGHTFEREIDEVTATKLIAFAVTGKVEAGGGGGPSSAKGEAADGPHRQVIRGSLASQIKAKKADKSQVMRFLATAQWLASRSDAPLTATAVAKALGDHNQKRLSNPADCLNQNVGKGFCEKRKDGSFFITPEGLEALDGSATE
jgi:hypothetical protein